MDDLGRWDHAVCTHPKPRLNPQMSKSICASYRTFMCSHNFHDTSADGSTSSISVAMREDLFRVPKEQRSFFSDTDDRWLFNVSVKLRCFLVYGLKCVGFSFVVQKLTKVSVSCCSTCVWDFINRPDGETVGWGCLRTGCWVEYLGLRRSDKSFGKNCVTKSFTVWLWRWKVLTWRRHEILRFCSWHNQPLPSGTRADRLFWFQNISIFLYKYIHDGNVGWCK
jgi:hypothetical protein